MSQELKQHFLEVDSAQTTFGLGDLALYFLRLGTFGFGGPIPESALRWWMFPRNVALMRAI